MPVEFADVKRAPVAEQILVVGNLIGAATVQVVPRVNGRLAAVNVQLGDSVRRGQTIAKVEDLEIQEQVRQAEAAYKVAEATIRQRDADLKLARTNKDRSEVANLIEKDMKRVHVGTVAAVEVDAFPGEKFSGRVSRVAPVFDPSTRTAEMEIEIPNSSYRLKPGMYSRVALTVDSRANALTIPRNALVELDGKPGVFIAASGGNSGRSEGPQGQAPAERASETRGSGGGQGPAQGASSLTAKFLPVAVGIRDGEHIEVTSGLNDGARVITTGAGALKDGDRIVAAASGDGRSGGRGERANREGTGLTK
jgi:multidrug efflux pump subunit AcrA (membrane-fusion protein)